MHPETRALIHLQLHRTDDGGELERGLGAAGWRTHGPEDVERVALRLRLQASPGVGLLDLRGVSRTGAPDLVARPALVEALAHPGVEWVAVLHETQLDCEALGRLVHSYCRDYLTHPCDEGTLAIVLGHALGMSRLPPVAPSADAVRQPIAGLVGESEGMRRLAGRVRKAARSEAPVFLSGETGTGKELVAAEIHRQSRRGGMPLVGINCGAIPSSLMQSELFGYERGAFTGAVQRKLGRVEQAHGGTLFLDEVADLPMESQASLLRFLEEGRIERLGGRESIRVDARIVCATHVDLHKAVAEGRFRADLYHRLRVIELRMPALRERGNDIVLIAHHALQRHAGEVQGRLKGFKACALRAMQSYGWPGNVRELINRVREAMVMAEGCYISARDLQLEDGDPQPCTGVTIELARREGERAAIERALARNGQRVGQAADELGISRVTLYRLMLRHGLHEARPEAQWRRLALVKGGRDGA
ncbi:sigma 54-interacting transcriptional regulator [Luteimonas sp. SDU101]|uniref:sigma-54 dependent transcriptional regulator n=1 Tax=unclassified Luteimonas TaxID=2629088 RepID=UPI003EB8AC49